MFIVSFFSFSSAFSFVQLNDPYSNQTSDILFKDFMDHKMSFHLNKSTAIVNELMNQKNKLRIKDLLLSNANAFIYSIKHVC